jgi:hypothetical protein
VEANPTLDQGVKEEVQTRLSAGVSFVPAAEVEATAEREGVRPSDVDELVGHYEDAQLTALKTAFLFAAVLVLGAFFATRNLPPEPL